MVSRSLTTEEGEKNNPRWRVAPSSEACGCKIPPQRPAARASECQNHQNSARRATTIQNSTLKIHNSKKHFLVRCAAAFYRTRRPSLNARRPSVQLSLIDDINPIRRPPPRAPAESADYPCPLSLDPNMQFKITTNHELRTMN